VIKDKLKKAEQSIKLLSKQTAFNLVNLKDAAEKGAKNLNRKFKKSKSSKAVVKASALPQLPMVESTEELADFNADNDMAEAYNNDNVSNEEEVVVQAVGDRAIQHRQDKLKP